MILSKPGWVPQFEWQCIMNKWSGVNFCLQYLELRSRCCCPGKCGTPPGKK